MDPMSSQTWRVNVRIMDEAENVRADAVLDVGDRTMAVGTGHAVPGVDPFGDARGIAAARALRDLAGRLATSHGHLSAVRPIPPRLPAEDNWHPYRRGTVLGAP
jgi:hypothetical protein